MAAAQVFALPELLENILFWMAEYDAADCFPSRSLFLLQRVNKTFQATIMRSFGLRQYMFLERMDPEYEDYEYQGHDLRYVAMLWLTEHKWGRNVWIEERAEFNIDLQFYISEADQNDRWRGSKLHAFDEFRQRYGHAESSWRHMRLDLSHSSTDHAVVSINEDSSTTYLENVEWRYDCNAKLGEFFDDFSEMVQAVREFEVKKVELERARELEDIQLAEEVRQKISKRNTQDNKKTSLSRAQGRDVDG